MDRRTLLVGLAAAAVAGPALAQTSGSSSSPMPSGSAGGAGAARMGGPMSPESMQHMQQTMQLGMVALETSRIALNKAQNADLKQFANFEVQEQTILSEVLRSMMEPSATSATGAASGQPAMNMSMDANAQGMIQKLQNEPAGASFDRLYLEGQLQGHRDLLQVQERYLQSNSQSREHVNVAKMARGQIREHIALLEDIQKKMR